MARLSTGILTQRKTVGIQAETVTNVTAQDIPGHYHGESNEWDITQFQRQFNVKFHQNRPHDAVFSLIGLDASLANAFRRILLAEIPTLAIEDVYIENNTSVIQDEVLAHRLGLIPLKGNKDGLRWLQWRHKPSEDDPTGDPETDRNTIKMKLKVDCTWHEKGKKRADEGETDPERLYKNAHVYAESIKTEIHGRQSTWLSADPVQPVNPGILLAKLRPGQGFSMDLYAVKGIGADHAKFSPVATASYRLLPTIDIRQPIVGADARKFVKCFPEGVIELQTVKGTEAKGLGLEPGPDAIKAIVKDTYRDTVSRECLRHEEFKDKVKLGRQRDHFIFSVESTGQFDSDELFLESVRVLKLKCQRLKENLAELIKSD